MNFNRTPQVAIEQADDGVYFKASKRIMRLG